MQLTPLLLAVLAGPAAASELPPAPSLKLVPVDLNRPIHTLCYPSGLRVTISPDDRAPVVSLTTVIGRESTEDPPEKAGETHLMEHLWFRSRPAGGPPVIARLVQQGAQYNGYTLVDATAHFTVVPKSELAAATTLEAARLTDPLEGVGLAELHSGQDIVSSEQRGIRLGFDDAWSLLPPGLSPAGHPYRDRALPTGQTVHRVILDDLHALATMACRPDHATLQVAGATTEAEFRDLIEASSPESALWSGAGTACSTPAVLSAVPAAPATAPPTARRTRSSRPPSPTWRGSSPTTPSPMQRRARRTSPAAPWCPAARRRSRSAWPTWPRASRPAACATGSYTR